MKKIIRTAILVTITILIANSLKAQQPAQYSLWQFNLHNFNPAYAGLDNSLSATGIFRRQWVGLEGAPLTQNINVHFPVVFLNSAFGFKVENDVLGAEQNLTATATYAYHLRLNESVLSIGLNGGIFQKSIDGTLLNPPNQDQSDDLIPLGNVSAMVPIFSAGVFFKNENIKAGVSASNLLETSLPYTYTANAGIQLVRNYFAIFAYKFEVGDFGIEPAVLVKSDLVGTQIDISTTVYYGEKLFGGAAYRGYNANTTDALALFAGYRVSENLNLAYAYDIPLSALSSVNTGSHEIMLNYNLNKTIGMPLPAKIIYNPRFTF
jgi:type IX secretion system PorP/SprF family membrane protein